MNLLVCRTDRIGDFVLSLPFVSELRKNFPDARIDLLISEALVPLVRFVKGVNGFVVYPVKELKSSWRQMLSFARQIKERGYDAVVALNPNLRLHLLLAMSGIPLRIGWAVKGGKLLLTKTLPHTKPLGLMHESQYNMLFLSVFGIERWDSPRPQFHLDRRVEKLFPGITVAVHPHASCPSKMWPIERYAELVHRLLEMGYYVVLVGAPYVRALAEQILSGVDPRYLTRIRNKVGIGLEHLVYLLAGCDALVSNDSGPVHIASAVDVPSVVIFGRNDPGLSPTRWRPLHVNARYLHKATCRRCLAHRCDKGFECLKAISVDDVLAELDNVLVQVKLKEFL